MLKYFYKTFLIAVISGSLTMIHPNIVMAQTSTSVTDSSGGITTKTSYDLEKVKSSDMIASIAMLAGGFITARMLVSYKSLTTDVMIAAAAGVAFVAGEVLSNVKFKGTIDKMTVEVERKNDKTVNEEQLQRLQDLKKSYEEAKSATQTKRLFKWLQLLDLVLLH
ncbi:MAG: hypothetical protein K2Q18_10740 [Bdellovibrionales bacterium]|nr:hypothetical protein [Bdellovibrionales bacterium]